MRPNILLTILAALCLAVSAHASTKDVQVPHEPPPPNVVEERGMVEITLMPGMKEGTCMVLVLATTSVAPGGHAESFGSFYFDSTRYDVFSSPHHCAEQTEECGFALMGGKTLKSGVQFLVEVGMEVQNPDQKTQLYHDTAKYTIYDNGGECTLEWIP